MKIISCCVIVLAATAAWAADPVAGDLRGKVIDELGNPHGHMTVGKNEVLFYDRGTIELTDGRVRIVKLITEDQLVAKQAAEAEQGRLAEENRKQLVEAGKAEKLRTLGDPGFTLKSMAEQLAYWQDFVKRYPGVDAGDRIKPLQQAIQVDAQQKAAAVRAAEPAKPPLSPQDPGYQK